jgi:hypothetical protein
VQSAGQAGQTLVLFALALVVILGLAALALDGGVVQGVRRTSQAISDGAALAGAVELASNPTLAQQTSAMNKAVAYATAGLAGGGSSIPDPSCAAPSPPTSLTCNPDPKHTLVVTTPFNGNGTDLMVQLSDLEPTGVASLLGITKVTIAARSVARHVSGGAPFGYALYTARNLTANGNVQTFVQGDVYVGGCVIYTNSDTLTTNAVSGGPPGNVEIYGRSGAQQSWQSGNGSLCDAHIFAAGFGATGNGNYTGVPCPVPQVSGVGGCSTTPPYPPNQVPFIDAPKYSGLVDSTKCQLTSTPKLAAWQSGVSGHVQPGCYDPCKISSVSDGMIFDAGDYAFFGNGTLNGCNFNFGGMTSSGTATGYGVTFWLYNGAGMCSTSGCNSSGKGALDFRAPLCAGVCPAYTGPNAGVLIYNPCQNGTCTGNGSIFLKGPIGGSGTAKYTFYGLIYAPYSSCTLLANAGQIINGQVVCQTAQIQGGIPSQGYGVFYGGSGLRQPVFDVQLIE